MNRSSTSRSRSLSPSDPVFDVLRGALWPMGLGFVLTALVLSMPVPAWGQRPSAPYGFAPGRILVEPKAGVADAEFQSDIAAHGGRSQGKLRGLNVHVVALPAGQSETDTIARLAANPRIKFAELDERVAPSGTTNDPLQGNEWHLTKVGTGTAWDSSTGGGTIIAIIDSGVDGTHADLKAQMVPGWNFWDNNSDASDLYGHGTAVAGTAAAAANNGIGVASVAWGARIMPVRISDSTGFAYWSTIAQGLTWAADNGASVANISYAVGSSSTVQNAAQYMRNKGGIVVVSAGNNGVAETTAPSDTMVIVSATDSTDTITSWSSYGSFVDLAAPGQNIYTTVRGGGYGYGRVSAAGAVAAAKAFTTDTTPPTVAIASPSGGLTVSGTVAVSVNASDNVGVARVDLKVNGQVVASDTAAPYSFAWNSTTVPDGSVSLTAVAVDAKGNSGTSSPVSINVANAVAKTATADTTPPTVAITSPASGSNVGSGFVTIAGTASDAGGLSTVKLTIDGAVVASGNTGSISYKWNVKRVAAGTHVIGITAQDKAGNVASKSINVTR